MDKPLVSIIIPVYNASRYLGECVSSVLSQDYGNIEVLVIDDGSDDGCVKEYADARVRVFAKEHGGASSARNFGISRANGGLITFADADDVADPQHISALVGALYENGADCAVCGYYEDSAGSSEARALPCPESMSRDTAVYNMLRTDLYQGFVWNKLFRRELIESGGVRFDENISYCEDLLFCAEYLRLCSKVTCVPTASYHYRKRRDSAVNSPLTSPERALEMLSGIAAIRRCGELYSHDRRISALSAARAKTECARLLRRAYAAGADENTLAILRREMSSGSGSVMLSGCTAREKIKYYTTRLFPRAASRFWNGREIGRLP